MHELGYAHSVTMRSKIIVLIFCYVLKIYFITVQVYDYNSAHCEYIALLNNIQRNNISNIFK